MDMDLPMTVAQPDARAMVPLPMSPSGGATEVCRMPQGRYVDAVRWMPPATAWHQSLAIAMWDPDSGIPSLELASFVHDDNAPSLQPEASWTQHNRISVLKTLPVPSQQALVAAASYSGSISFLVSTLLHNLSSAVPIVSPCLHQSPITDIDLQPDIHDCVSVGEDGKINLVKLGESSLQHKCVFDSHGFTSFTAARWASPTEFVTAGLGYSMQWWDHRRSGGAVQATNKWNSGIGGGIMHSVDVHPSRKHVCVVGGSNGTVLAWDLRWQKEPILLSGSLPVKGRFLGNSMADSDVWEVKFDPFTAVGSNSRSNKMPSIMLCSEDGILGVLETGQAPLEILAEPCAINTFDINPENGSDVICGLEFESLLYLKRSS